ncbi:FAD:protein FMN transferase [Sphingomonas prati]|uniref:FAD:protein FMN transferase n=1 Tax=Sphingomonas prati TaxID=1843237 RepID=A0A7W9F0Q9_9SPHN|nr:FAD:protein FMN transferase [Sphingomonas prati]MBB5728493.1 thiamine biosynthesis lipoprotein [Sphingomonas prati]GGE73346.1 FAD:protein FMN transferase [Sphingomonas prati]
MRIALPPRIAPYAFARRNPSLPIVTLHGETMGTLWRVLFACPRTTDPHTIERAIITRLTGLVGEMSHWDRTSLLSEFNQAPAGRWLSLPPDFARVVATALTIAEASDGAYDPTIGRLVDLWGYGPPGPMPTPDAQHVATLHAAAGWQKLQFEPGTRRLRQPGGLALDLAGIAKGDAVDAVADLLATQGIHDCLVEIGGELTGRGIRPDGDPWWVDPETPPGTTIAPLRLALHELAVATSGNAIRGDHTLDPRTGHPVKNGVISTTVIHARAGNADAWATALTVIGGKAGLALATKHDLATRIIEQHAGIVTEHLSPALIAMLED